jgi:hypothetical protein
MALVRDNKEFEAGELAFEKHRDLMGNAATVGNITTSDAVELEEALQVYVVVGYKPRMWRISHCQ